MTAAQFGGLEMSRSTAEMLNAADKDFRKEAEGYEARREEADYRAWTLGPAIRAQYQAQLAEAQSAERAEEAVRTRRAAERQAQMDAYVGQLILGGRTPRSIGEWAQLLSAMP